MPPDHSRAGVTLRVLAVGSLVAFAAAWLAPDPFIGQARNAEHRREDALEKTLLRCQAIGEHALADAQCRTAWTAHRRHFLQVHRSPERQP